MQNSIEKKQGFSTLEAVIRDHLDLPVNDLILGEIIAISREIPENANNISPSNAQYLAGRFLKGMDLCGELYAISIAYELKMEVQKKREHGQAFILRSKNKGLKTAKEKEAYANTDEIYLEVADRYAEAKMFRVRVETMRKDFEKAHYLMRKISDQDNDLEGTELPSLPDNDNGWKKSWSQDKTIKSNNPDNSKIKRTAW